MLNRITINTLLKSVIVVLAAVVIAQLSFGAWSSWKRFQAVDRIAAAAETSTFLFTALHNLRVDRASTFRDLAADKQFTELGTLLKRVRAAEMPALDAGLASLENAIFPEKTASVAALSSRAGASRRSSSTTDSWAAMRRQLSQCSQRSSGDSPSRCSSSTRQRHWPVCA